MLLWAYGSTANHSSFARALSTFAARIATLTQPLLLPPGELLLFQHQQLAFKLHDLLLKLLFARLRFQEIDVLEDLHAPSERPGHKGGGLVVLCPRLAHAGVDLLQVQLELTDLQTQEADLLLIGVLRPCAASFSGRARRGCGNGQVLNDCPRLLKGGSAV